MIPLPILPADGADYPPLSALNDLLFCARRCFLHRVEGVWVENVHTTAGTLDHRRVHQTRDTESATGRTARGLWVTSHRLRLTGVCDLVEFRPGAPEVPFPVEYKRGKRRTWDNDEVQLCAQAMCLEEMLGHAIPSGAIFHVKSKRRREIAFTPDLRERTGETAERLHALLAATTTPPPVVHPKCKQCSVRSVCMPDLLTGASAYRRAVADLFRTS
ncbi:CRISPR-associated protein Cas4 [Gemmata sp. G18]|uniref:CRISPR-associated exonuclease Cas4 n=1 Tax=Gemmata palustris TaxID=2822762 RepID=A0ABS5BUB6_9BACT|nr:CRISPR-associated protein Cas4 [Gemmata palustris]MBP3956885.1 CRISPR-associated protein Cas4 [Gemmata palustris]